MTVTRRVLLVHVTGPDRPGISAALADCLARHRVNVLDIGQAVIHDQVNLGLLVELPGGTPREELEQEFTAACAALGLAASLADVSPERYRAWVAEQGKPRHIVTLLSRKIRAREIARVTAVVTRHGLNIDQIRRLSGRIDLDAVDAGGKACVEFSVRGDLEDTARVHRDFLELAGELNIDIAIQEDNMFRRTRRLVAFDMDSTLIKAEVIDELAQRAGCGAEVAAITERAMRGELDFQQSFRQRVALLQGLPEAALAEVAAGLELNDGAERLVATLRRLGYRTAILSGGFSYFGRVLQQRLGIDFVHANELEISDGAVSGQVSGPIVDGARKAELLRQLAAEEGISLQQVIAVGDGANDLPMLSIAGLGIAFRAKPVVRESARHAISTLGLDGILYLLGISDREAASGEIGELVIHHR
jgi:phosphoserine phosphatase